MRIPILLDHDARQPIGTFEDGEITFNPEHAFMKTLRAYLLLIPLALIGCGGHNQRQQMTLEEYCKDSIRTWPYPKCEEAYEAEKELCKYGGTCRLDSDHPSQDAAVR